MKMRAGKFLLFSISAVLLAGCSGKQVSFKNDVMPIFAANCIECHKEGGVGFLASGFSVESYESIMKGTKFGPVIVSGQSVASTIKNLLMHKANPQINMPKDREKLPDKDIETISKWIDQGAKNN